MRVLYKVEIATVCGGGCMPGMISGGLDLLLWYCLAVGVVATVAVAATAYGGYLYFSDSTKK